jgi:hypothetical protein
MARSIVVSSYCWTAGIVAALRLIFPRDVVLPLPLASVQGQLLLTPVGVSDRGDAEREASNILRTADVWLTMGGTALLEKYQVRPPRSQLAVVELPYLIFHGFHPDTVFANTAAGASIGVETAPTYGSGASRWAMNSAIALWAWRHKIDLVDAVRLFNKESYHRLGYFDVWDASVNKLRAEFDRCDFDFDRLFRSCKRLGVFMHTLNHPKFIVISQLAKQIAVKLGAREGIYEIPLEAVIPDALSHSVVWPVYPEIGEDLGVPTSYLWKFGEHFFVFGLEEYVTHAFQSYAAQGLDPEEIVCDRLDDGTFDRALGPALGITT